ncbi:hypothetical protein ABEB36_007876 [Hypothenemus hampei]|uniref:Uncharacterized protein n=1 Tax=Hypothenemus hampei TaxID=57062 RepID=A0ABD1EVG7_HYPHA
MPTITEKFLHVSFKQTIFNIPMGCTLADSTFNLNGKIDILISKKKTTTGHAACSDRLWKYEKQMEFLISQLTNRPRSTNAILTQDISQVNIDETRELLTQQQSVKPIEVTAVKKIFESVCEETYNLTEYLPIKIQRQIFNVVMEAREANLQRQSENPVISVPTQSKHKTYVSLQSSLTSSAAATNNEIYFISTSSPILSPSDDHFVSQANTN